MSDPSEIRYRDEHVELSGIVGVNVDIPSANPTNFHQAINDPHDCEPITIDGKLFLQPGDSPQPLVMVVPGSLGVGPNHRAHSATLVAEGYSVFTLDPFGARAVTSTVANQTQYSFAGSGLDVLAAWKVLNAHPRIDGKRITAQGHSRGGAAVATASMRRFADPIVGEGNGLAGAYAVYPWCGQVFRSADIGSTVLRAIIGDLDEWCSVQQMQAQVHALQGAGAAATMRVVPGAHHSFDRLQDLELFPDAAVAPNAPTVYIEDDGSMTSPYFEGPSAELTDYDVFVAAMKAGHAVTGARIGSADGQPELFLEDMLAFHRGVLG